jgi:hypothetical protein
MHYKVHVCGRDSKSRTLDAIGQNVAKNLKERWREKKHAVTNIPCD